MDAINEEQKQAQIEEPHPHHHHHHHHAYNGRDQLLDAFRVLLMLPVFFYETDFEGELSYLTYICRFAPIAYFILSGYLVLRPSQHRLQRIRHTVKRTAITFLSLAAAYLVLDYVYYGSEAFFTALLSRQTAFSFFVMNQWPFRLGELLWYVMAQLYAYGILYVLEKKKLLKSWTFPIIILGLAVNILTGELADVIELHFLEYTCVPSNFLTSALPYLLVGMLFSEQLYVSHDKDQVRKRRIWKGTHKRLFSLMFFVLGIIQVIAEAALLEPVGKLNCGERLLGMNLIAFGLCYYVLTLRKIPDFLKKQGKSVDRIFRIMFYLQPVLYLAATEYLLQNAEEDIVWHGAGIILFCVDLAVAVLIQRLYRSIRHLYHVKQRMREGN